MEQGTCRPLRSPHATWKSPQCSTHRLRKKAVDLCQYCRRARNPLDRNSRYDLMVATADEGTAIADTVTADPCCVASVVRLSNCGKGSAKNGLRLLSRPALHQNSRGIDAVTT